MVAARSVTAIVLSVSFPVGEFTIRCASMPRPASAGSSLVLP
jgi:hypothetical protein